MRRALLGLLLLGCSARPPAPSWPATPVTTTLPLVVVAEARRPLVQITLDGRGPFLFAVDPAVSGGRIVSALAAELGLETRGDPARGRAHTTVNKVGLGALTLEAVRLDVVEADSDGPPFDERAVAGTLGTHLLTKAALEIDPGAGVLRLLQRPEPPPPGLSQPLHVEADGRLRLDQVIVGTETVDDVRLSTSGATRLSPDVAAELEPLGDPDAPRGWVGAVGVGPAGRTLVYPHRGDGPGQVGWDVLRRSAFRVSGTTLHQWPATPGQAWRTRFPASRPCGADFSRCLVGRVEAVRPGALTVHFAAPELVLPDGWWLSVDAGRPGAPRLLLVHLRPVDPLALDTAYQATFNDPHIHPDSTRAPGAPLTVVDVVPLGRRCGGHVCLRRGPVSGFIDSERNQH